MSINDSEIVITTEPTQSLFEGKIIDPLPVITLTGQRGPVEVIVTIASKLTLEWFGSPERVVTSVRRASKINAPMAYLLGTNKQVDNDMLMLTCH